MFKPRPAQQEESVITPTEKYFLKIREGVSDLSKYEVEDNTAGSQTLACSGDSCEVVDISA